MKTLVITFCLVLSTVAFSKNGQKSAAIEGNDTTVSIISLEVDADGKRNSKVYDCPKDHDSSKKDISDCIDVTASMKSLNSDGKRNSNLYNCPKNHDWSQNDTSDCIDLTSLISSSPASCILTTDEVSGDQVQDCFPGISNSKEMANVIIDIPSRGKSKRSKMDINESREDEVKRLRTKIQHF